MISVLVSGFDTEAEAEAFIDWYSGQGEQDAGIWFECRQAEGEIDSSFMPCKGADTFPVTFKDGQANLVLRMVE